MKYLIIVFIFLMVIACSEEQATNDTIEQTVTSLDEDEFLNELVDTTNPLPNIQPPGLSPDKSWIVSMDIQEGFFLSYTINYQSGAEITIQIDESYNIIGGIDFTSTKWLNNETYYIPHIGGSIKGHWDLEIYKDGTCKYIEVISQSL